MLFVHLVSKPRSGPELWIWWALAIVSPWVVYIVADRVARRVLPLVALLKMTLVFPDHAPSRLAIARRAGSTRGLARQLEQSQEVDAHDDLSMAAERILALAASLSKHDRMTRGHSERVRALTDLIAEQIKLPPADRDRLRWASLLHDIGKLSVPASVLNKPGKPDEDEWQILLSHPIEGKRLVAPLADWLGHWAASVPEHHERYDGSGYPLGLAGEQISIGGRIVAVADTYDAMTSTRSYSRAATPAMARQELTACAGAQFDPVVVRAFLEASVGRLRVVGGPLAWLGELFTLNGVPQLGQIVGAAGSAITGVAAVVGVGLALVVGAHHPPVHAVAAGISPARSARPQSPATRTDQPALSADRPVVVSNRSDPPKPPPTFSGDPAGGGNPADPPPAAVSVPPPPSGSDPPATSPVNPLAVPGAPSGVSATAGDASATVAWAAPASDGGSPVTGYMVLASDPTTPVGGGETCGWTTGPLTCAVTGLTNGDTYSFTVRATNSVGLGPSSPASDPVTPLTVPGEPSGVSAAAGNADATVTWGAPTSDGGSPVTGYRVTTYVGLVAEAVTTVGNVTTDVVGGLTDGDTYSFTVTAINAVGLGPTTDFSNAVTPATVPGAPSGLSAAAGNADATVTWTAPASDGGSAVTGYRVTTYVGLVAEAVTTVGNVTTDVVGGLTDGDTYSFTVTAINGVGLGPTTDFSNTVTPATLPGAPSGLSAAAGNADATVTWTAPASDGGSAVTGYTVVARDSTTPAGGGETCSWTAGPLTCTLTGLTNGDTYSFTVRAANSVGLGPSSPDSNTVTPATVPGAPSGLSATGGDADATVTWAAPASDGGSAVTGYRVTTYVGLVAEAVTTVGNVTTDVVGGLTDGDTYSFTVTAINAVGLGPTTDFSNAVTPATVPGAPSGLSAAAGNADATVTWEAPASDGGSAVTGYTVVASDSTTPANGGETCSWTAGPLTCTLTGLTNGDTYSFTVWAANSVGLGPSSPASNTVTPATVPGAPSGASATAGDVSATVAWTAPASDGGSPVTGYTVVASDSTTPANGGETCSWTTGPLTCTVTGLTNGDTYSFTVRAINGIGLGPSSPGSNTVTPGTVPGVPSGVSATAGNADATVTWTAPASDGGSPVTGYTVVASDSTTPANGGETCSWTTGPLTCTVTGLTNGDTYSFTVWAINGIGLGPSSPASNPVTPLTVPGAPSGVSAAAGDVSATVTWTAPASDGGSPVTGYTVVASDSTTPANGGEICSWTTGPLTCTVTGLNNGDTYSFTVAAVSAVGEGPASTVSNAVIPGTAPDPPTISLATPGVSSAMITWIPPISDGGAPVTSYTVVAGDVTTPANGGQTCTWTSGPLTCTVTGLTAGDVYVLGVSATNDVGSSTTVISGLITPLP